MLSNNNLSPIRWTPSLNGVTSLLGEKVEPTDKEKLDGFFVAYQEQVDPLKRYEKYFSSEASLALSLSRIKQNYKKLVIDGCWEEKDFVLSLDAVLKKGLPISTGHLEKFNKNVTPSAVKREKKRTNTRRSRW